MAATTKTASAVGVEDALNAASFDVLMGGRFGMMMISKRRRLHFNVQQACMYVSQIGSGGDAATAGAAAAGAGAAGGADTAAEGEGAGEDAEAAILLNNVTLVHRSCSDPRHLLVHTSLQDKPFSFLFRSLVERECFCACVQAMAPNTRFALESESRVEEDARALVTFHVDTINVMGLNSEMSVLANLRTGLVAFNDRELTLAQSMTLTPSASNRKRVDMSCQLIAAADARDAVLSLRGVEDMEALSAAKGGRISTRKISILFKSVSRRERFMGCITAMQCGYFALTRLSNIENPRLVDGQTLLVHTATWNVGDKSPPKGGMHPWLVAGEYDLYAIGMQECSKKQKWVKGMTKFLNSDEAIEVLTARLAAAARANLGSPRQAAATAAATSSSGGKKNKKNKGKLGYTMLSVTSLWDIHIFLFIRKDLKGSVARVTTNTRPTGIANVLGNKGGAGVGIVFEDGTSLAFLTSHLAARATRVPQRQDNYEDICADMNLEAAFKGTDFVHQFHHVFWLGDLNYRVDFGQHGSEEEFHNTLELVNSGKLDELRAHDQLGIQMARKAVFVGFQEGPLDFPPTYRMNKGEPGYSNKKNQNPSYCDRVLWRSHPGLSRHLELLDYNAGHELMQSDHRPIMASFRVRQCSPYVARSCMHQSSGSESAVIYFSHLRYMVAPDVAHPKAKYPHFDGFAGPLCVSMESNFLSEQMNTAPVACQNPAAAANIRSRKVTTNPASEASETAATEGSEAEASRSGRRGAGAGAGDDDDDDDDEEEGDDGDDEQKDGKTASGFGGDSTVMLSVEELESVERPEWRWEACHTRVAVPLVPDCEWLAEQTLLATVHKNNEDGAVVGYAEVPLTAAFANLMGRTPGEQGADGNERKSGEEGGDPDNNDEGRAPRARPGGTSSHRRANARVSASALQALVPIATYRAPTGVDFEVPVLSRGKWVGTLSGNVVMEYFGGNSSDEDEDEALMKLARWLTVMHMERCSQVSRSASKREAQTAAVAVQVVANVEQTGMDVEEDIGRQEMRTARQAGAEEVRMSMTDRPSIGGAPSQQLSTAQRSLGMGPDDEPASGPAPRLNAISRNRRRALQRMRTARNLATHGVTVDVDEAMEGAHNMLEAADDGDDAANAGSEDAAEGSQGATKTGRQRSSVKSSTGRRRSSAARRRSSTARKRRRSSMANKRRRSSTTSSVGATEKKAGDDAAPDLASTAALDRNEVAAGGATVSHGDGNGDGGGSGGSEMSGSGSEYDSDEEEEAPEDVEEMLLEEAVRQAEADGVTLDEEEADEAWMDGEYIVTRWGARFHESEFCCQHTGRSLLEEEFVFHEGKPYLKQAYYELFGHGLCSGCLQPFSAADNTLHAMDRMWHKECFRCAHTGRLLPIYAAFFEHNCVPYCRDAYMELFHSCPKCMEPVPLAGEVAEVSEDHGIRALNAVWHRRCFRCVECDNEFQDGHFHPHDADDGRGPQPYCETCYTDMFMPACPGCSEKVKPWGEDVMEACGQMWHREHFRCAASGVDLGDHFFEHEGLPYSEDKFYELFGQHCPTCGEVVHKDCVSVLGQQWHSGCFCCASSGVLIPQDEDGAYQFYERDLLPYSRAEYARLFCEDCLVCNKKVVDEEVEFLGKAIHPQCLRCQKCSKDLLYAKAYEGNDSKPYCAECYTDAFGQVCAACGFALTAEDRPVEALDRIWHVQHFTCMTCEKELVGAEFFVENDIPFCQECYQKIYGSVCDTCGEMVDPTQDSMYLQATDKHYHRNCYCCVQCSRTFVADESIFVRDADAYCQDCFSSLFCEHVCSYCGEGIMGAARRIGGREWHPDCVKCFECSKELAAGQMFTRSEKGREEFTLLCCMDHMAVRTTQLSEDGQARLQGTFAPVADKIRKRAEERERNADLLQQRQEERLRRHRTRTSSIHSAELDARKTMEKYATSMRQEIIARREQEEMDEADHLAAAAAAVAEAQAAAAAVAADTVNAADASVANADGAASLDRAPGGAATGQKTSTTASQTTSDEPPPPAPPPMSGAAAAAFAVGATSSDTGSTDKAAGSAGDATASSLPPPPPSSGSRPPVVSSSSSLSSSAAGGSPISTATTQPGEGEDSPPPPVPSADLPPPPPPSTLSVAGAGGGRPPSANVGDLEPQPVPPLPSSSPSRVSFAPGTPNIERSPGRRPTAGGSSGSQSDGADDDESASPKPMRLSELRPKSHGRSSTLGSADLSNVGADPTAVSEATASAIAFAKPESQAEEGEGGGDAVLSSTRSEGDAQQRHRRGVSTGHATGAGRASFRIFAADDGEILSPRFLYQSEGRTFTAHSANSFLQKSGHLSKRGGGTSFLGRKGWNERFFVLADNVLQYYKTEEDYRLNRQPIKNAALDVTQFSINARSGNEFVLQPKPGAPIDCKQLVLRANSEQERAGWVEALEFSCNQPSQVSSGEAKAS